MLADDIRTIERNHYITIYEAYHVHNYYHIFATQYGGSGVEIFTDDTAPFNTLEREWFYGERWIDTIEAHLGYKTTYVEIVDKHLVMAEGACDVRYFDAKSLPMVIEYVVTEEYIDEESE